MEKKRLRYGRHRTQTGDLWLPSASSSRSPVVVLIHGGFWRGLIGRKFMNPLAEAICSTGIAVWNIEYRRVGMSRGGWPTTLQDVAAAIDVLATTASVDPEQVFTCGHSAGGHLALWATARSRATSLWDERTRPINPVRVRGAISLAGVSDLARAEELNLGNGAAAEFLGGSRETVPLRYREASPAEMLPLGVRQILIHGLDDTVVPASMSENYVVAARQAGDDARYVPLQGVGHRELITAPGPVWDSVAEQLEVLRTG